MSSVQSRLHQFRKCLQRTEPSSIGDGGHRHLRALELGPPPTESVVEVVRQFLQRNLHFTHLPWTVYYLGTIHSTTVERIDSADVWYRQWSGSGMSFTIQSANKHVSCTLLKCTYLFSSIFICFYFHSIVILFSSGCLLFKYIEGSVPARFGGGQCHAVPSWMRGNPLRHWHCSGRSGCREWLGHDVRSSSKLKIENEI